jgi:hypothetical protein
MLAPRKQMAKAVNFTKNTFPNLSRGWLRKALLSTSSRRVTYQVPAVSRLDQDGGVLLLLLLLLVRGRLAGEADDLRGGVRGGDRGLGGRRGGECDGHGVLALLVLRLPDLVLRGRGRRRRRRRREGEGVLRPQLPRQPPLALGLLRSNRSVIRHRHGHRSKQKGNRRNVT